jgi:hypothetical protein
MPRLTFALSWVTKASFIDPITGSRRAEWGLSLTKPSLAPTTRTPVASASSPSSSVSIVPLAVGEKLLNRPVSPPRRRELDPLDPPCRLGRTFCFSSSVESVDEFRLR